MLKQIIEEGKLATSIEEATDGESAIEMYKKLKPDLVTLDINMPHTDGLECLKELLKIDPSANVLMVTSVEQKSIVDSAMNSGAKGYVKKPFNKNEITETVQKLLN